MRAARRGGGAVVVIIGKQPVPGRAKTRLCPPLSPKAAARLSEALLSDTAAIVSSATGVTLAVAVTRTPQAGPWRPPVPAGTDLLTLEGEGLGACLQEAACRLFISGFSRVILLNSDGPTLPPARIEQARRLLDSSDVVVGPSEDGGYYLVGMKEPQPALFAAIAWSTRRVLAQTLERAAAAGLSVALLEPWYDVDTPRDLARLRREMAALPPDALPATRRFFGHRGVRCDLARGVGEVDARAPGERRSCDE